MEKETAMNFDTNTYFELNGTLVRFWKDHGITDKEDKIAYLERLVKWYKSSGYVILDRKRNEQES